MKSIGILGGMGAPASLRWYQELIRLSQEKGAIQDGDYPEIYLINCKLHDWDEKGIVKFESVKNQMLRYIHFMNILNPDYIILACNTIHYYHAFLQSHTKIPIISIIDNCLNNVKGIPGVLCSETTRNLKLYGTYAIYLSDEEQVKIDDVILKCQSNKSYNKETIKSAYDYLIKQGADSVIIGCTELPLAIDVMYPNMIDSGGLLLKKVINLIYE